MGHYSSWTQINARDKNGATIRVTSQAIIEVRPAAFAQIWHPPDHKWLEQMYLPSDPRLEWPGEGSLFWAQNECTIRVIPGPLFMSDLGSLAK